MSDEERRASSAEDPSVEEEGSKAAPPSVPMRVGDAPFRSLLAIPEAEPGFIAEAKREIRTSAYRRLEALEQVHRQLLEQAQEIATAARRDLRLHDLPLSATKIRGQTYHLYERADRPRAGRYFLSLLGPADYGAADPRAEHRASYRLNEDSSWTRLDGAGAEPWIDVEDEGDER